MLFDDLVRKVDPAEPDRKLVERRVFEVITAMGRYVDEATGEICDRAKPLPIPRQRNVRWY